MPTAFQKSALIISLGVILSGCASLIPAKQMQARIIETTRNNIITTPSISTSSKAILLASGLTQESCMMDFKACLDDLKSASFTTIMSRDDLVLMAELHYTQALHLSEQTECMPALDRPPIDEYYANTLNDDDIRHQRQARQECLQAYRDALFHTIKYSYGYLFYNNLTQQNTNQSIVTDNDIRAQDLYHVAINALIQEVYKQQDGAFANADSQAHQGLNQAFNQLKLRSLTINHQDQEPKTLNLYLANDNNYLNHLQNDDPEILTDLISIYDYRMADLQVNSTRSGLGVGFVGSLKNRHTTTHHTHHDTNHLDNRIHPMGHLLLTAIVMPKGDTLNEVLSSNELDVHFFNPYATKEVSILGKNYPLSASFSSTYATWLSENNLKRVGLLNMIAKKDSATLPELFMLSPYNPNQKVIIMIHGLASSPSTWVDLTNNLLTDPILRNNYQVWQIFYATNLPILENRHQIHELVNHAFAMTDPNGLNPSSHHAVLIGHSMGGVISRMLVSDDDLLPRLNTLSDAASISADAGNHPNDSIAPTYQHNPNTAKLLTQNHHEVIDSRFKLNTLPQVSTAIFISAPFRGTDYADRWFTRAARKAIQLPVNLTKNVTDTITNFGSKDNIKNNLLGALYLQNGADQLSDRSTFMQLTADIHINDNIRYHTIVGDYQGLAAKDPSDIAADKLSDGIVPYSSSHLAGADSETIITGRHNIHENPKTILQLRKILHEHLQMHDKQQ